jgi:hypothetical protein
MGMGTEYLEEINTKGKTEKSYIFWVIPKSLHVPGAPPRLCDYPGWDRDCPHTLKLMIVWKPCPKNILSGVGQGGGEPPPFNHFRFYNGYLLSRCKSGNPLNIAPIPIQSNL